MNENNMVIFLILIIFAECIRSLKLSELHVPAHLLLGARAQMWCRWEVGPAEQLYSVKWYKDGKEFFSYMPGNQEPLRKFKLPGVEVEESDSSGSNLTLARVSQESSGRYRCEVSGEKPLFPTVSDYKDMQVLAIPDHGPVISGFHSRYKVGHRLEVKCTSGRSQPPTHLEWYINGEPAPVSTVCNSTHQRDNQGFEISSLTMTFIILEQHFIDNRLKIKCLATLFPFYWKSNEESAMKQREPILRKLERKATEIVSIIDPINLHPIRVSSNCGRKISPVSNLEMAHTAMFYIALLKIST